GSAVVNVGASGTGTLTLEAGATWTPTGSNVCVGGDNFAPGTTSATNLGGNGTLNIKTGASYTATNLNLAVGRNGNGVGTVNVTEGGLLTITSATGNQFLNLANRNGNSTVPEGANYPVATINISGATSSIRVPHILVGYGTATLNLNGGTLTAGRISKDPVAGGSATINMNGTRVKATVTTGDYFEFFTTSNLTLNAAAGGLIFDTNGNSVTFKQPISGTGGLTKSGEGALILTNENTYTGDTVITQGSVHLQTTIEINNLIADSSSLRMSTGTTLLTNIDTEVVHAFYIDGQPQAAGLWGPIGSGVEHESALITGDGLLQVTTNGTVTPVSPFATWTGTKGLTGENALATADPDNDGYSNLLEFILGGEPNPATAGANTNALAPTVTSGAGSHTFSFRRTALSSTQAGLVSRYEYGSTLNGWTPVVDGENGISVTPSLNGYGDGIDRVDITIPDTLSNDGKIFVRLAATLSN
ncbi:MAG: hypothetical protein EOP85_09270, partial [Verrucomicrobiaceae bacterium]